MYQYADVTRISGILTLIIGATAFMLPFIMATTFHCTNRKWVTLAMFIPVINCVLPYYLIYKDKKGSKLYEDYGKNVVWVNIAMYIANILALFTPMTKIRLFEGAEIDGATQFNLSDFLSNDGVLSSLIDKKDFKTIVTLIWVFIIASIIGCIINLIIRDGRKIFSLWVNIIVQGINIGIVNTLTHAFDNFSTVPGIAFTLELIIISISVISIFATIYKTSYVDN